MTITVILCTYNRCESLAKTLASVANSILPGSVEWEVLVVDNNSTDQTRAVTEGFSCRFPGRFRYLFEPQPGKSFALNSGIRAARGDVLVFSDDDVCVESTWLGNLTATLDDTRWAGAGGRILPARKFSPPRWMSLDGPLSMGSILFAHFDLGDTPCELTRAPFGANMAFRKSMFQKYGGFRTDLGPRPGSQLRNEDTEFGDRLMAAGERLRYEPSAVVYHPVPQNRVTKDYLLTWHFDYGRARVREWGHGPDVCGVPRRFLTVSKMIGIVLPKIALLWMLRLNPRERFIRKCWVWMTVGNISELYRQLRTGRSEADKRA
jgi:glucosyl-dolichyl phosphate glucuronosyltransferase